MNVLAERPKAARRATDHSNRLWRFISNYGLQLSIGIVVTSILPLLIRFPELVISPDKLFLILTNSGWLASSVLGGGISFALGLVLLRQMLRFPNTQGMIYVIPVFLATYSLLFSILLLGRIEFSRYIIIFSFVISIIWGFLFVIASNRMRRLCFAITPYGDTDGLIAELSDGLPITTHKMTYPGEGLERCDAVVADLRAKMPKNWERFLASCALERIPVYHVKQIFESTTGRIHIEHLSENQFGSLLMPHFYEVIKRVWDLLLSLALLPFLVMLVGMTALAIKLDDRGCIFFTQRRMGFRGRPFTMLKFRTMLEKHDGPHHTLESDVRITRVGKFLRRHRLDELPQAFNILRGEMSWIGPRPESMDLTEWYEAEVPFYQYRHIVRPGITGWAQVNQGQTAGVGEAGEKLQYDFFYIKHFSPWLDLLISIKTLRILLTGYGAR